MSRSIAVIAQEIYNCWDKISPYAQPYLDAMVTLDKITEDYFADSGRSVVAYFLSNAASWRGEDARRIKAELNQMLKDAR